MTIHYAHRPSELDKVAGRAEPGDRIRIAPGEYLSQTEIRGLSGRRDNPIVFEADSAGDVDCGKSPDPEALREDFAFIRFTDCRHVHIQGLSIRNAWPAVLIFKNCHGITVSGCSFTHGTYAILAKQSSEFLLENNVWVQDDTADHELWHKIDWLEAHGGEGGGSTKVYYNGAFFWSKNVSDVRIIENKIRDAYNGIRMKVDADPLSPECPHNRNVIIERNEFVRIRDNPIEPERFAYDWHIRHNRILDAHAWFSMDGVQGGYWYIYGDTGRFESRQGARDARHHTMGRVLKLSYESVDDRHPFGKFTPALPWYVFNNSFYLRCPLIGGAAPSLAEAEAEGVGPDITSNLTFSNNVFEWCDCDDEWICEQIDLLRNFQKRDGDGVVFSASLTNRADYLLSAERAGVGEAEGRVLEEPLFEAARTWDFRLAAGVRAAGADKAVALTIEAPGGGRYRVTPGDGGRVDRGALQSYGPTQLDDIAGAEPPVA